MRVFISKDTQFTFHALSDHDTQVTGKGGESGAELAVKTMLREALPRRIVSSDRGAAVPPAGHASGPKTSGVAVFAAAGTDLWRPTGDQICSPGDRLFSRHRSCRSRPSRSRSHHCPQQSAPAQTAALRCCAIRLPAGTTSNQPVTAHLGRPE